MDIKVGRVLPAGDATRKNGRNPGKVEARLLAIRPPRRRTRETDDERRDSRSARRDPVNGKVLVLMVPDGTQLPEGLANGEFRVFITFARR